MKNKNLTPNTISDSNLELEPLFKNVSSHIDRARNIIQRSIDIEMVKAYWLIGRDIVEEENKYQNETTYGKAIIKYMSQRLTSRYGRGFSEANIKNMRLFSGLMR